MVKHWFSRIRGLVLAGRIHREIEEEREFHIAMRQEHLACSGMTADEAGRAAKRSFGASARMHEMGFDVRGGGGLAEAWLDLRLAFRLLLKTPVRTAALVLTVALGIGINVAVFSVMKSVVLDPLPFRDSHRLAVIHQTGEQRGRRGQLSQLRRLARRLRQLRWNGCLRCR